MNLAQIRQILVTAVEQAFVITAPSIAIEYPESRFGDFSTNAAFLLAKQLQQNPIAIAETLATTISTQGNPLVASATALRGFVNVQMAPSYWIDQLHAITPTYGLSMVGQGKRALVEFISANPTGPLTLANGRGAYMGDVLASVLSHAGYTVEREYYLNDAGNQIQILRDSVRAAAMAQLTGQVVELDSSYKGPYIAEWGKIIASNLLGEYAQIATLPAPELANKIDNQIQQLGIMDSLIQQIKTAVGRMGIEFTTWFSEASQLHVTGKVGEVVQQLQDDGYTEDRDGALWLTGASVNSDDRVLRKSDGTFTYLAADLAYHRNKLQERSFDLAIDLWGPDHAGQVPSLKFGVDLLKLSGHLDIIIFQIVRLIKDGVEFKISKRAGTYITIDELLDTIPSDVLRFFFLMRSHNTPMDLDFDLAAEQSQKNPYYYVMYSYARANSILEQASLRGLTPLDTVDRLSTEEVALVRHISRFPKLIDDIRADYGVHRLTFFGIELAKLFHDLYESERIIGLDRAAACKRLYVIQRYTVFMRLYFGLLGITPLQKMVSEPPAEVVGT